MALAIKEEQKSVEARNGDEMNQQVARERFKGHLCFNCN